MDKSDPRNRAFISYSHADGTWARWLHRSLESYRTPKYLSTADGIDPPPARLTPIFRDREDLASSADLSERIRQALEDSMNLIVICSPQAARSRWVNQEIEVFKRLGRADRVFALIVDGDPDEAGGPRDCFPPALRARYDSAGKQIGGRGEPVAADVRKSGDGKSLARLKIIAGLLNVGLDQLRRREVQRRQRRMAAITAGSLSVSALTIWLAVDATLARGEAEQRRQQADDLLGFMVGDLRQRLEPIGRLDLLEDVSREAMRYFATVNVARLTDSELARQARVMRHVGEIRMSQLDYPEALRALEQAYERSAALQENRPRDGQRLFDRAQNEFWIGYLHWRNGDLAVARHWLTKYRDSSIELHRLDSERIDWAREVAYGHHNLAVLDEESGDLESASAGFSRELDILRRLEELEPSGELRGDVADAVSWLGNIALKQGRLTEGLEHYRRSLQVLQELQRTDMADRNHQFDVAHAMVRVVNALSMTGATAEAGQLADEAIASFDALAAHDPDNVNWKRSGIPPRIQKGYLLLAAGRAEASRTLTQAAIRTLKQLIEKNAEDHHVHEQLANANLLLARIDRAEGNYRQSLRQLDLALSTFARLRDAGRMDEARLAGMAAAYILRGEVHRLTGGKSDESWLAAESLLQKAVAGTRSPVVLDPWARLLALRGRKAEYEAVRGVLEAQAYRPIVPWPPSSGF